MATEAALVTEQEQEQCAAIYAAVISIHEIFIHVAIGPVGKSGLAPVQAIQKFALAMKIATACDSPE